VAAMVFRWLRRGRPPRDPAPLPPAWRATLDAIPWARALSPEERTLLEAHTRRFVDEKTWEGCAGLVVTDEMKVVIAAHAARLALHLPADVYRRVSTILVYPSAFVNPRAREDASGVMHEGMVQAGEAWHGTGPVIVAWDSTQESLRRPGDGYDVLSHEFAHKLDLLDGWADGTPSLARRDEYEAWNAVTKREFAALRADVARDRPTLLGDYAATDPAEFFAVATEVFFERPRALRDRHPDLYRRLSGFYRQDPAERDGRSPVGPGAR
jgi:Mlc titration factor MtfA (ptsG expression regulator)